MRRFIPEFVLQKYIDKEDTGILRAYVLQVDVVDFTQLTSEVVSRFPEGTELIAEFLSSIFSNMIDIIAAYQGFISVFQGDGFVAVFPQSTVNSEKVFHCASNILKNFVHNAISIITTNPSEHPLCCSISCGSLEWGLIDNPDRKIWYFYGDTLLRAEQGIELNQYNKIVCDSAYLNMLKKDIPQIQATKIATHYCLPYSQTSSDSVDIIKNPLEPSIADYPELNSEFVLDAVPLDEYRGVTTMFIQLVEYKQTTDVVNTVLGLCRHYGSFFNKIDVNHGYLSLMVLFGAPKMIENQNHKAAEFALVLNALYPKGLKISIADGNVFAGAIGNNIRLEYTVLGTSVNLAARMAYIGNWGEILVTNQMADELMQDYQISLIDEFSIRGLGEKQNIYLLSERAYSVGAGNGAGEFFGRTTEIRQINSFMETCRREHTTGVVSITGVAGIGKTRLLSKILTSVQYAGYQIIHICYDSVLKNGSNVISQIMVQYFGLSNVETNETIRIGMLQKIEQLRIKGLSLSEVNILEASIDELSSVLSNSWFTQPKNPRLHLVSNEDVFSKLSKWLIAESKYKHFLVSLDNLQWIDQDSLKWATDLISSKDSQNIYLISISRVRYNGQKLKTHINANCKIDIALAALSHQEINSIILDRINSFDLAPEVISQNHNRMEDLATICEGNPLFLEQLLLFMKTRKISPDISWVDSSLAEQIPKTIQQAVIACYDSLDICDKEIIQFASVFPGSFQMVDLKEAAKPIRDISETDLFDIIISALDVRLIKHENEDAYSFYHSIVKDAVYSTLLSKKAKSLHKLLADYFEKQLNETASEHLLAEIAYHYHKAEHLVKAATFYKKAGDLAKNCNLKLTAIGYYLETEQIYRNLPEYCNEYFQTVLDHLSLIVGYADASKIDELLELAASLDKSCSNSSSHLEYLHTAGLVYRNRHQNDRALEYFFSYLQSLDETDQERIHACTSRIGETYHSLKKFDKSFEYFNRALELCDPSNHRQLSLSYMNLGVHANASNNSDLALAYLEKAKESAIESNDEATLHSIMGNIGIAYRYSGQYQKAISIYTEMLELSLNSYANSSIATDSSHLASLFLALCNYPAALEHLERAVHYAHIVSNIRIVAYSLITQAMIMMELGNYDQAIELVAKFRKQVKDYPHLDEPLDRYFTLGMAYQKKGNLNTALRYFNKGIEQSTTNNTPFFLYAFLYLKSEILVALHHYQEATGLLNTIISEALDYGRDDAYTDAKILLAELAFKHHAESLPEQVKGLIKLYNGIDDKEQKAYLTSAIYRIATDMDSKPLPDLELQQYKNHAIKYFEEMLRSSDRIEYRRRLNQLYEFQIKQTEKAR